MNILITMKMSNRSLKYHILPLVQSNDVDLIYIVRDDIGPKLEKVIYFSPIKLAKKNVVLCFINKFILMCMISLTKHPDKIHSFILFPHGLLALIIGKIFNIPTGVSLLAGPVELSSTSSPINKYAYDRPFPKRNLLNRFLILILNNFVYITVTGTFTRRYLIEVGIPERKIYILPHFINKEKKKVRSRLIKYQGIFIGRLAPVKHVENLIRSLWYLKQIGKNPQFIIVGDGSELPKLKKYTIECGLENNVTFTGYRDDIWNLYGQSKFAIITSEREGFPMVVIESMMSGLPLISTRCGDVCDVLKHGENALLVDDYKDYITIGNFIADLSYDDVLYSYLKKNVENIVETWDVFKVTLVWNNILDKNK